LQVSEKENPSRAIPVFGRRGSMGIVWAGDEYDLVK